MNSVITRRQFAGTPLSILVCAPGGKAQIIANQTFKPDLFICGELSEWETAEYIRDARAAGLSTALIIAGHVATEEPGMKWLASWLTPQIKEVVVTHVPARDPFTWV